MRKYTDLIGRWKFIPTSNKHKLQLNKPVINRYMFLKDHQIRSESFHFQCEKLLSKEFNQHEIRVNETNLANRFKRKGTITLLILQSYFGVTALLTNINEIIYYTRRPDE